MRYLPLIWANLSRSRMRTLFTILSVVTAFVLFGVLAAVKQAFTGGVDLAGVDRLMVMNRMAITQPLPLGYGERIRSVDGVAAVTHATYFEGYFREPRNYVAALAVDPEPYLAMFREYQMDPVEEERWSRNPAGVAVGRALAERFGWKVGDKVPLVSSTAQTRDGSTIWELTVEAIFDVNIKGGDSGALLMHYSFLNEGRLHERDTAGWFMVQAREAERSGGVARSIDHLFENSAIETKTWTEKALAKNLVAQFGDIGKIVTMIASAVFFSMLLVAGNTMAQAVRERIGEYATMKAIGFSNGTVVATILGESLLIVVGGAAVGLMLAVVINGGIGEALERYLPSYQFTYRDLLLGSVLGVLFGLAAGLLPALEGRRVVIAHTLRGR